MTKARFVAMLILLALLAHTFSVGTSTLQASDPGTPLREAPRDRKPPQEAVAACTGKAEGDTCEFTTSLRGLESGTCALSQEQLACAPQRENQPERRPEEANPDRSQSPADRQPPRETVDACTGKAEEDACEFTTPLRGLESGTCALSQEQLACAPQRGEPPAATSPEGKQPKTHHVMTTEQTVSDEAQRNTIAFDTLAFLTGDLCADSFLPPGKVVDFFGFQYLRDNDPDGMGHNTDFVTRSANNMLYVLNEAQDAELVALAENQVDLINRYAVMRFPLMKAFRRNLEGDLPAGSSGLDKDAVMEYSARLYELDAEISLQRAKVFGNVIGSLDQSQRDYLDNMAAGGMLSWPELGDQIDKREYSHDVHVAVMTYASEMFAWYAGSPDADTYFCPERQGTYFGSFYLKDAPAMGNRNYSVSTELTADSGKKFLEALTDSQRELVTGLVDIQRDDLLDLVETRREISAELHRYMTEESIDEEVVYALAKRYGELDGELIYYYATYFAQVYSTLSSEQKARLTALRNLDDFSCSGAYLYSENIGMPEIEDTDFLFVR